MIVVAHMEGATYTPVLNVSVLPKKSDWLADPVWKKLNPLHPRNRQLQHPPQRPIESEALHLNRDGLTRSNLCNIFMGCFSGALVIRGGALVVVTYFAIRHRNRNRF